MLLGDDAVFIPYILSTTFGCLVTETTNYDHILQCSDYCDAGSQIYDVTSCLFVDS